MTQPQPSQSSMVDREQAKEYSRNAIACLDGDPILGNAVNQLMGALEAAGYPVDSERRFDGFDAIASAVWAWERLSEARTLTTQADALIDLSNAMSDLASWHPTYDLDRGTIPHPDDD